MEARQQHTLSHLFSVRLWTELLGNNRSEIRCRVRHLASGETRHFRDWSELTHYLQTKLQELDAEAALESGDN